MLERDWIGFDEDRWHAGSAQQVDEVQQIYAVNRAHHWNSSTMVVKTIYDRLRESRPPRTDGPTWTTAAGEQVHVNDHVALSWHLDSVGRIIGATADPDVPQVLLVEGPWTGAVRDAHPADVLLKVERSAVWE
jgi:hypothetical protein